MDCVKKELNSQHKVRLSLQEYELVMGYRRMPGMQGAIDNILGISSKAERKPAKIICVCEKGK